jgi:hypothetical protein
VAIGVIPAGTGCGAGVGQETGVLIHHAPVETVEGRHQGKAVPTVELAHRFLDGQQVTRAAVIVGEYQGVKALSRQAPAGGHEQAIDGWAVHIHRTSGGQGIGPGKERR